ncbi:sensor histidine kinase [Conexibacter woesei]|uniref:histidine kinase n=1 Tax=Conexibacter woesei (strain DSM 14684 / CCUG 47730 / CIP 108061 / JCM 11494 / NBRC 100937 / ID131577) TaxID=469383 RepID=D3F7N3_CONWI|nr:sensor histidine kinase [Conexibacter woesei]ADB50895.1 integral membrane sensor signal transduction histidine kinase [Conexibacter woesei DSM 14684]
MASERLPAAGQTWSETDELRRLVPLFALTIAVVAAVADPAPANCVAFTAIPVVAFALWARRPTIPLVLLAVAVVVPLVLAQRGGALEPILFEASLLSFVVGRWAPSPAAAIALGLLAASAPIAAAVFQDPSEVAVGIWLLGVAFPWVVARGVVRQTQLAAQLEQSRRELAQQALREQRREIARDVHDFVGHGLAAVMLQVTSARHVLRRDPDAAEEALRTAEEVGRHSMRELRRTVTLLRSDEEAATGVAPPLPSAHEIAALVDQAHAGGLAVELRTRGDVSRLPPSVAVALYRIAQEALANAARHAPHARTRLTIELDDEHVRLTADSDGARTGAAGPAADVTAVADSERPRYGLIGMRERATVLGGTFSAGPTAGGWRIRCELPLEQTP